MDVRFTIQSLADGSCTLEDMSKSEKIRLKNFLSDSEEYNSVTEFMVDKGYCECIVCKEMLLKLLKELNT